MGIKIACDFECANACNIRQIDENHFSLCGRPDNAVNLSGEAVDDPGRYRKSDYYISFRITNTHSEPRRIKVDLYSPNMPFPREGRTIATRILSEKENVSYRDWKVFPETWAGVVEESIDDGAYQAMRVSLEVPAGTTLDISTMYWMSYSEVEAELSSIEAEKYDFADLFTIGQSAGGRDIWGVRLGGSSPGKKPVIIGATPQSHELGTILSMELISAITSGERRGLLNDYSLYIIPVSNPDGNVMGTCMTNSRRENLMFGFSPDSEEESIPQENRAIWNFIQDISPEFYLELHSYPHLDRPSFRPYLPDPNLFPDARSQRKGEEFLSKISDFSPNPGVEVKKNSQMHRQFRSQLTVRLIADLGLPATLYKFHSRESVASNSCHARKLLRVLMS